MATCTFCGVNIPQLPQGNEVYHPDDLVCKGCLDEPEANPYPIAGDLRHNKSLNADQKKRGDNLEAN